MGIFKFIGSISLQVLALISAVIILIFAYFSIFVDTTTIGVNNISDQLAVDVIKSDELSEEAKNQYEERWFMEANYYSNANENGIQLRELNFNYFMSPKLLQADYRASGMQTTSESNEDSVDDSGVNPYWYYYDTVDGVSYSGYAGVSNKSVQTILNRDAELIIKIDNRPFTIQLTGSHEVGWWIFKRTVPYTYQDLFRSVMSAIETNSAGYGDYYITLDLSYYFSIKEMNENGQFKPDDVTDIIKNYAVLKFHYDENGAVYSNQSMFGKIENNSKYDKTNVNFWAGNMVYTLTEKDFSYRYVDGQNGYYISIPNDLKLLLANTSRYELNIDINLDSIYLQEKGNVILGFDFKGFSGFSFDTIKITGKASNLSVLDGAFAGSSINTLKHSNGITFTGDFGVSFDEVII